MVVVGKGGRIEGGGAGSQNLGFLEGVLHTVLILDLGRTTAYSWT